MMRMVLLPVFLRSLLDLNATVTQARPPEILTFLLRQDKIYVVLIEMQAHRCVSVMLLLMTIMMLLLLLLSQLLMLTIRRRPELRHNLMPPPAILAASGEFQAEI